MNTVVDFQLANNSNLTQVRTRFDEEFGVMTYYMNPEPRPCFNKICMSPCLWPHFLVFRKGKHAKLRRQITYSWIEL